MEQMRVGNAPELNDLIPGRDWHSCWDSPEAFSKYIAGLNKANAWQEAGWDNGDSFSGTMDMAEALELSRNGWTEGVQRIERLRSGILAAHPVLVKAIRYDIAGSVANVPRAISGNPLNMKALDLSKSRRRPIITLVSNMSANCGVHKDAITNRAAVVAAIIDQIECMGYACEVIATAPTLGYRGDNLKVCTSVMVKASNQAVDIGRLSFGLGHASMFRRMVFADWGIDKRLERPLGQGLGSASRIEVDNDKGIYILPSCEGYSSLFSNEEVAATKGLEFLLAALTTQGCPAFMGSSAVTSDAEDENDF